MASDDLKYHAAAELTDGRMLLGFSGWMDGGDVSTGTIEGLIGATRAVPLADIRPDPFYLYNFPGSMDIAALFRPHCRIEDGLVRVYDPPTARFHLVAEQRLVLFVGKEPNLRWDRYADGILDVAQRCDVQSITFIGSVGGPVPHTRQPRVSCSVSDPAMKQQLEPLGVRFSQYEGPASFVTYLTVRAAQVGLQMATLVVEIPAYVQARNPQCIEAATRRIAAMLALDVDLVRLREEAEDFERKLNLAVSQKPELQEMLQKLEEDYDSDVFDTQMPDLKDWLEQKGIRLD